MYIFFLRRRSIKTAKQTKQFLPVALPTPSGARHPLTRVPEWPLGKTSSRLDVQRVRLSTTQWHSSQDKRGSCGPSDAAWGLYREGKRSSERESNLLTATSVAGWNWDQDSLGFRVAFVPPWELCAKFFHLNPGEKSLCLIRFTKRSRSLTFWKCSSPHCPMNPLSSITASIQSPLPVICIHATSSCMLAASSCALSTMQTYVTALLVGPEGTWEVLHNLALCWLPSLKTHYIAGPHPSWGQGASAGRFEPSSVWHESTISR